MRLEEAFRTGLKMLEESAVPSARIAAEVLQMHTLACDRAYLHAHPERHLSEAEQARYACCLQQRAGGKPTQYITGRQEFWGLDFRVTAGSTPPWLPGILGPGLPGNHGGVDPAPGN